MADTNKPRERRYYSDVGGITELDLIRIRKEGDVSQELLNKLAPYFEKMRQAIHEKWEIASLTDDETLKILKYQLKSLTELQRLMTLEVSRGKQAAKKLEETKHGKRN